jgi:D-apionolactonase
MAKLQESRAVKLTGTEQADGKKRTLAAGAISAVLDNGAIRYIRYNGVEVLRGIAYLVRDKNWGTYAPKIENLKVRQERDGFTVSYTATCRDSEQGIRYDASIEATSEGTLKFSSRGFPLTDVVTNRTGFVVLHPLVGIVGESVEILHTDGKKEKNRFPKVISPGQPVFEIRSLKHQVMPGVSAKVLMEGNKFEMEDHRNWMDASYKTYVCSLLDPWPYTLKKGEAFEQSVTVLIEGKPKSKIAKPSKGISVALGKIKGKLPMIGAAVPMAEAQTSLHAAALVSKANLAHLVCQIDGRRGGAAGAASAFRTLSETIGKPVTLEIILPAKKSADEEVAAIARDVKTSGLKPAAIVVTQMHDLNPTLRVLGDRPTKKWPRPSANIFRASELAEACFLTSPSSIESLCLKSCLTLLRIRSVPSSMLLTMSLSWKR